MRRKILLINGNPDPRPERLCAALSSAYAAGAERAGHEVRLVAVGALDFGLIGSAEAFNIDEPPPAIVKVQEAFKWADHIVIIHPLWLGGLPAKLKGFLEQVLRNGFAMNLSGDGERRLMKGRSIRLVVTMAMPALVFRTIFGAFGLRAVERGMLWACGFGPIRHTLFGNVRGGSQLGKIAAMQKLGARGA